ncbi:MAG: hypothetical protein LUF85_15390 [Bacteroides sp.]|nr:hypothetical protein [Bacteroides sp.]
MKNVRKEKLFDLQKGASEEERIFLKSVGEVLHSLHQLSRLHMLDVAVCTGIDRNTLTHIYAGRTRTTFVNYQRIFGCYLQDVGAQFYLLHLLRQLPLCVEQRLNLIVSLMNNEECRHFPPERQILIWKTGD